MLIPADASSPPLPVPPTPLTRRSYGRATISSTTDASPATELIGRVFALEPRHQQWQQLDQELGRSRWAYNRAVALARRLRRIAARAKAEGRDVPAICKLNYAVLCQRLTRWRQRRAWLAAGSVVAQQQTLKDFDRAMANAWAGRAKPPVFKKRSQPMGVRFLVPHVTVGANHVQLPKMEAPVRFRRSCEDLGEVRNVTVRRNATRWSLSVCYQRPADHPASHVRPPETSAVGLDFGVVTTWTTSDARQIQMPRYTTAQWRRLRRLQRSASRKTRGSQSHRRTMATLRKIQRRVLHQRDDAIAQFAHHVVRDYAVIGVEDLNLKGMSARPRDRSGARNNRAAKAALNRKLLEGAFAKTVAQVQYAAKHTGARVIPVDARNSSRACRKCGHTARESRESQAVFRCVSCGHTEHADLHASRVIEDRARRAVGVATQWTHAETAFGTTSRTDILPRRKMRREPGATNVPVMNAEPAGHDVGATAPTS